MVTVYNSFKNPRVKFCKMVKLKKSESGKKQ